MNIEIANRLVELRKKNGLSQEQLAEKLGLSRQAVSKWERAESSPDTDNLICLAKLYGVSLDELLNTDTPLEELADEQRLKSEEETKEAKKEEKKDVVIQISGGSLLLLALIGYLLFGFLEPTGLGWRTGWSFFLFAIFINSVFEAIKKRRFCRVSIWALAVGLYGLLAGLLNLWHPLWIIFLVIPVWYCAFAPIDSYIHRKDEENEEGEEEAE